MADKGWSRRFEEPIALADGRELVTLRDAGEYIAALPAKTAQQPHWQTAVEMLILVAEDRRPLMFAHIGMMRALNAGQPKQPEAAPRRRQAKVYHILR